MRQHRPSANGGGVWTLSARRSHTCQRVMKQVVASATDQCLVAWAEWLSRVAADCAVAAAYSGAPHAAVAQSEASQERPIQAPAARSSSSVSGRAPSLPGDTPFGALKLDPQGYPARLLEEPG